MGTGKGTHRFWATRVPVSRIIFELKGEVHEKIVKEAFRLAGNKMPGNSSPYRDVIQKLDANKYYREIRIRKKGRRAGNGLDASDAGVPGLSGVEKRETSAEETCLDR